MSNIQWTGNAVALVPARPAPTTTDQFLGAVEKMIAGVGGPVVKREYKSLGDAVEGNVSSSYVVWTVLSIAGAALAAYHGYKRNHDSTGSAVGWGVLGGLFPIITVPVALAQGFGKPAGSRDNPESFNEVGKFEHEGVTHEAGGAFYDRERGVLAGYPSSVNEKLSGVDAPPYELRQWGGTVIAPLRLVSKYRGGFGREQMWSWSATYDGRVFHGRNLGPNMLLRMRAGRSVK